MGNALARQFISVHSRSDLDNEVAMAEELIEMKGTVFPDDTFEEGYIAALKFVLNEQGSNVREDYEDVIKEGSI